ncbi:MAG: TPM domain-containing protein [Bacteroidales bacterium]|nr:TPM domain-containing protein [Bacteroidales bacterium]
MFRPLLLTLALLAALPLQAGLFDSSKDGLPEPSDPPRLVNDFASVIPAYQRDSLEQVLVAFDDSTSNQICIVTMPTLDGREIVEYGTALGNKWGIGSKRNNGVLILLKIRNPQLESDPDAKYVDVAILPGRGLEGAIPDAYAARIIRNIMGPYLREDDYSPALMEACAEVMALAAGEISEPRDGEEEEDGWELLFYIIIFIIVLIIIAKKNHTGGSGRNSGTGGGFGGPIIFGGGGSSSGGSFSGGGFGGFGGGSFGGGGAHGRF